MPTIFPQPIDDVQSTLTAPYTPGDTSIAVAPVVDNPDFGTPTPESPVRVTITPASNVNVFGRIIKMSLAAYYRVTGRTGDTLTGLTFDGGTDQAFPAGSFVAVLFNAESLSEVHGAVNAAEATIATNSADIAGLTTDLATRATDTSVLHTTGDEVKTGTLTVPLRDKGGQVYNVKAYGATGNGTTDDTVAIQAAINACMAGGGGTVFLPAGKYLCNGDFQTEYAPGVTGEASVLIFPCVRFSNQPEVAIRIVGAAAPMLVWGSKTMPAPAGGTILKTTKTGGCLFSAVNTPGDYAGFSAITVFIEDFSVETYDNPDITVFEARYLANFCAKNICVYPRLTSYVSVPEPTHSDRFAFRFPSTNNAAVIQASNLLVYGHYNAYEIGECFEGVGQIWAFHCKRGLLTTPMNHGASLTNFQTTECPISLVGPPSGTARVEILQWRHEFLTTGWEAQVATLSDPGNRLYGSATICPVQGNVGPVDTFTKSGGANFDLSLAGSKTALVRTTGSYANPAWITSILGSIVSGDIPGNAASITGSITTVQVTGLDVALAAKAALAGAAFTGDVSFASATVGQVLVAGTAGVVAGSANLKYSGGTLKVISDGTHNAVEVYASDGTTLGLALLRDGVSLRFRCEGSAWFQDTAGNTLLRAIKSTGWTDNAVTYFIQSGTSNADVIIGTQGGNPSARMLLAASKIQITGKVFTGLAPPTSQVEIISNDAATKVLAVRAFAGQTANLIDVQDSGGASVAGFAASAALLLPTLADAAASNGSIFFGSDHLDGSSVAQLCRKQGGVVTVIG